MMANNFKLRFKMTELHYFNWLFSISPCFPLNASKISIISDPRTFYDTICERFQRANSRITMASLYIGTGTLEKRLLSITKENIINNKNLKFDVLLDYHRGTRGHINSRTLLQQFVDEISDRCHVYLYQTPKLQAKWSHAVPARYNELIGLQHMKLYIVDDIVLLSGANCSTDYFERRQDRYIEIQDPNLADFYSELVDEVNKCSKQCTKEGFISNNIDPNEVNKKISNFIEKWKEKQISLIGSAENDSTINTWVFPLIQMGEFSIKQDEQTTQRLMASVPKNSYLRLATGYFNLTEEYALTLLRNCHANVSLLMAHPNANGFLGASGPAGGIPYAYSLIAKMFWQKVLHFNQEQRIQMLEYERPGWTFHAKGLWYYPPGSAVPWATIVGSANMGERSVHRDLEAQAVILTSAPELQDKLHNECTELHKYSTECSRQLQRRQIPLWVRATVGLFRNFF